MKRVILSTSRHDAPRQDVALVLALLVPACYSSVPLDSGVPATHQEVRVRPTGEAAREAALPMRGDDGYLADFLLRTQASSLTVSSDGPSARRPVIDSRLLPRARARPALTDC